MTNSELHFDGLPKILPAYENGIFQAMLTLPEAKEALISAVSTFIDRPVKSVTLRDSRTPKRHVREKLSDYDINCVVDSENGDQCEIEMQASQMRDDSDADGHKNIRWRSAFYLSRLHAGQDGRGKSYSNFARSYQIMLCNYKVFNRKQSLAERFTLKSKSGNELCDAITSIFIDLTKAKEIAKKPISEMTSLEMWIAFLALANNPGYSGVIDEITKKLEGIAVANSTLQNISQNQDERIQYYRRAKALQDEEHNNAVMKKALDGHAKIAAEYAELEAKNAEVKAELADKEKTIAELQAKLASLGIST